LQGDSAKTLPHGSAWLTLVIFIVIAHFNPEVLTGSTPIEHYFTWTNFLGMLFYGLQVAVLADIMARYKLRWTTVYLLGLVYGIFEEGFAVQTMLSPIPPGFVGVYRVLGLNSTWAVYIATFHALVSVISSIIIVKLVWPDRVSYPFLGRRHYAIVLPSLIVVYGLFIYFVTRSYTPETIAVLVLVLSCLALVTAARRAQRRGISASLPARASSYVYRFLFLIIVAQLLPFALGQVSWLALPVTLIVVTGCYLFARLFGRLDRDDQSGPLKLFYIFVVVIGFWLVLGTFFRTPASNMVAFTGVALEFYFGWRAVKRSRNTPASSSSLEENSSATIGTAQ